jgi:hypothetical protein
MNAEEVQGLVVEVTSRLAPRLGADGRRGRLIVAFSGATASFPEAVRQCRALVLDGYQVRLAFSPAAEQLFGSVVRDGLAGFPHVSPVDPAQWLGDLMESQAVVCPILSMNTLSKVSLLTADTVVSNLLLHGLFMGKPVVLARDGVDLAGAGRKALGIDRGTPALRQAVDDRLRTAADFGCHISDVSRLRGTVNAVLAGPTPRSVTRMERRAHHTGDKTVVTAADVRRAHRAGSDALHLPPASLVTPLARDLAMQLGVHLSRNGVELE